MDSNTTSHDGLMSIITSISANTPGERDRRTVSPKDRQAPSSHHSFSQRGLCSVEIPNEEFAADIPCSALNLQVPILSGGERQSSDSHDLLGSYNEGIFILITGNNIPRLEVYPRPVHYRQRRATSWPGHCDASKLSRITAQCGPTIGMNGCPLLPHLG